MEEIVSLLRGKELSVEFIENPNTNGKVKVPNSLLKAIEGKCKEVQFKISLMIDFSQEQLNIARNLVSEGVSMLA